MNHKKLPIILGLPMLHHTVDLPNIEDVNVRVLHRFEFSIEDIRVPVIQNPNGMTNRQRRKHEETRKRKGRK